MFERILLVVLPVFLITALGYFVAKRSRPDFDVINRLGIDVFGPMLVFGALAGKDFHIADYWTLSAAMVLSIAFSGAAGWVLARGMRQSSLTWMPPIMFGNSGNLGIPMALLAFGDGALPPTIVLFMISFCLQFVVCAWLLDRDVSLWSIWKVPTVMATVAGCLVSLAHIQIWPPVIDATQMVGKMAVALNTFALGVRLVDIDFKRWHEGVIGGVARPLIGGGLSAGVAYLLGLSPLATSLLILFGAMPPGITNFILAERYNQEPHKVASIVLIGNAMSIVVLPLALTFVLR